MLFRKTSREKKHKVLWIHCNYSVGRMNLCLRLAESFLHKMGLFEQARLIVVQNGSIVGPIDQQSSWLYLQGSNRSREFSAWQEGWEAIGSEAADFDFVVLTNDTFPYHQPYYLLGRLLRSTFRKLIEAKEQHFALGVVERGFDADILPEHITSCFMAFDRLAAASVMPCMTKIDDKCSLADDEKRQEILTSTYKDYKTKLNAWLLQPGLNSWYDAAPLTESNYDLMAGKAQAILLEHSLSRRLLTNDVRLVSCFDFPLGFLARWLMRIDILIRNKKLLGRSRRYLTVK